MTCEQYIKLCKDGSREITGFTITSDTHVMVTHRPTIASVRANKYVL